MVKKAKAAPRKRQAKRKASTTTRRVTGRSATPIERRESRSLDTAASTPSPIRDKPEPNSPVLTHQDAKFVDLYVANGGNGAGAYRTLHPEAAANTSWTEAWRILRKPEVKIALETRRAEVWAKHRIDGDQALDLIALVAKADISDCYDDDGKQLPIEQWPIAIRMCVKEVHKDGTVKLLDPLKARELIAVAGGKIRQTLDVNMFDHEHYLASRTTEDGKPAPRAQEGVK